MFAIVITRALSAAADDEMNLRCEHFAVTDYQTITTEAVACMPLLEEVECLLRVACTWVSAELLCPTDHCKMDGCISVLAYYIWTYCFCKCCVLLACVQYTL
jgi:hypothetical protein